MARPLHVQIRRGLEERIRRGSLPAGARLPTEKELSTQFDVSRHTAQKVLNDLAQAGLAVRRRPQGTFVADVRQQVNLLGFATPGTAERGVPGRHEVVSARVVRADKASPPLPGAAPETAVIEMVRRKLDVRDQPHSIERHSVLFSSAPNLLEEELGHLVSLAYLRSQGVQIDTMRVYLDPVALSQDDADLLDGVAGTPALQRRRELRSTDGTVIEVVTVTVRPGAAEFFLELPATDL